MERRKYLGHVNRNYVKTSKSQVIRVDEKNLIGYAALIKIDEVSHPFLVGEKGSEVCLSDNGYSELCYLPDNENWTLWAMYDNNGCIIEWYFDITRKNSVDENGEPYCDDLYLDAALMPDGQILILDEDELSMARDNNSISQDDFDMAHNVLNKLIEDKIISVDYIETLCSKLLILFE